MVPGGFFRDLERRQEREEDRTGTGPRQTLLHSSTGSRDLGSAGRQVLPSTGRSPAAAASELQDPRSTARVRVPPREAQPGEAIPVSSCVSVAAGPIVPS